MKKNFSIVIEFPDSSGNTARVTVDFLYPEYLFIMCKKEGSDGEVIGSGSMFMELQAFVMDMRLAYEDNPVQKYFDDENGNTL